ncbi:malonyl-ACP O-methyltransferase BioC [Paenibacillus tarimensis]
MLARTKSTRRRFSRKAHSYDEHAAVQRTMAETLLRRLVAERRPQASAEPLRILEIGCGTGLLTASLLDALPGAHVTAIDLAPGMLTLARQRLRVYGERVDLVQADIEQWAAEQTSRASGKPDTAPYPAYDLILSNACFQWLIDPAATVRHLQQLAASGGMLLFSTFGPGTFHELHDAFRQAYAILGHPQQQHGLMLAGPEEWTALLCSAGWLRPNACCSTVIESFPSVRDFLHSVKAIGASSTQAVPVPGLSTRRLFAEMTACYEREYATLTGIPASYELLYHYAHADGDD